MGRRRILFHGLDHPPGIAPGAACVLVGMDGQMPGTHGFCVQGAAVVDNMDIEVFLHIIIRIQDLSLQGSHISRDEVLFFHCRRRNGEDNVFLLLRIIGPVPGAAIYRHMGDGTDLKADHHFLILRERDLKLFFICEIKIIETEGPADRAVNVQVIADQFHLPPPGQTECQAHGADCRILLPLDQGKRIHITAEISHGRIRKMQFLLFHFIDTASAQIKELIIPFQL